GTHHSVPDDRARPAPFRRFSCRPRRPAARRRCCQARIRARRISYARRRRRNARRATRAPQGVRMKMYHSLEQRDPQTQRPLVLAIGFFDGMHRGHMEIARQTLRLRKPGWRAGVLTFANHPASFLRPVMEPSLIATPEERVDAIAAAGFDE